MSATLAESPRLGEQEASCDTEISVVMPCLNEARTVGRCVDKAREALRRAEIKGEVIVADNGSTDGSPEIARRMGPGSFKWNAADMAARLQAGIAAANGRFVIMGDADDSYDFSHIEPFVQRLREGYDLVMGNRFRGGIRPGAMPRLHRYFGNPLMTGILNFLFRSPIHDVQCGLAAFRKRLVRSSWLECARVWSSRARWWPRLAFSVKRSPRYRSSFTPTVEADRRTCEAFTTAGETFGTSC